MRRSNPEFRRDSGLLRFARNDEPYDIAGRTLGTARCLGPHFVKITLVQDSAPSRPIEVAVSTKKFCAVASCVDSHQPPMVMKISRAVCASTGPSTLAAPCEEKYIAVARPRKAYIGAAVDRYCWLAARTAASSVKMLTQRSGKMAMTFATRPTDANETRPAIQAIRRARATRSAPTAMPTIGTEAMPTANEIEVSMNSSRAPMP